MSTIHTSVRQSIHIARTATTAPKRATPLLSAGRVAAMALAALLLAGPLHAISVTQTSSGPAQAIPDDGYDGSLDAGTVASSSITIDPMDHSIITDLSITVAITHDYVGDLTIELERPDGDTIFLANRPGLPFVFTPGQDGGGDSSNLSGDFPITFYDDAPSHLPSEWMGAGILNDDVIGDPSDPATVSSFIPSDGPFVLGGLSTFAGSDLVGTWTLHVGDSTAGNAGVLHEWTLSAVTAPAPGAATAGLLLMSGLVGGGLIRRPRRRRQSA